MPNNLYELYKAVNSAQYGGSVNTSVVRGVNVYESMKYPAAYVTVDNFWPAVFNLTNYVEADVKQR